MPLRENELARRTPGGLELRAEPLRVKWEFPDLVTSDGHELGCTFTGSVRALPDRTERRMLEELLLDGRHTLVADDVARHFYTALRGAAARVAQAHDAREWVETDVPRRNLIDGLKAAALPVAFACGLEVLPPFQADFQSGTFERQRVRALQQALIEKEAAGQVEHFQRTAELLKQFQALRSQTPELSAGRVLQQVNPADQGALMQALLMAGARQQPVQSLWAVAGPYLVQAETAIPIDSRTPPRTRLIPLPPTLGPLRSVQADEVDGKRVFLIGAQHGFLLVQADDLSDVRAYQDRGIDSPLGFNRVVYWPQRKQFCATHSEAGLVCWDAGAPDAPARAIRPAELGIFPGPLPDIQADRSMMLSIRGGSGLMGPRNLRLLDSDALVFSAGGRIIRWDGASADTLAQASASEIVALFKEEDENLLAIHEDGTICALDHTTNEITSNERRFGRLRSAGALPWLGSTRVLLAADDGPVQCVGFEDPLVTQYFSAHRGLRVIAGSSGIIAAVSSDRQRLVLWNSWDGKQPAAELFIAAQTRHRIADITFA